MISINRYDELDYAEKILQNGFITNYRIYESKILAKYYKYKGLKPSEIKEMLYEFYKDNIEFFNEVIYYKKINSIMNYVKKESSKLISLKEIIIPKDNFEYIKGLDLNDNYKRFIFAFLIKHILNKKIYNITTGKESDSIYFSEIPVRQKEVFNMCGFSRKHNMNEYIHVLYENKILDITDSGKLKLLFLKDINVNIFEEYNDENIKILTKDINNIKCIYGMAVGNEKYKRCEVCDTLMKVKKLSAKYCKRCGKVIDLVKRREYSRNSMRKLRVKRNSEKYSRIEGK